MPATTSSGSPPRTADMPVAASAQAAAISRPRSRASATAASGPSTPASAAAASSPTLWPAVTTSAAPSGSSSSAAAASAVATSSGWVTAVSRISSASAAVPSRTRSRPLTADSQRSRASTPGTSSHGASIPGAWAPWPGARRASMSLPSPVRTPSGDGADHEVGSVGVVGIRQFTGVSGEVHHTVAVDFLLFALTGRTGGSARRRAADGPLADLQRARQLGCRQPPVRLHEQHDRDQPVGPLMPGRQPSSRPSTSAIWSVNRSRGSVGVRPQTSATRRSR